MARQQTNNPASGGLFAWFYREPCKYDIWRALDRQNQSPSFTRNLSTKIRRISRRIQEGMIGLTGTGTSGQSTRQFVLAKLLVYPAVVRRFLYVYS